MARRSLWRRFERFLLGIGMGMAAFIIERRVIKAIKKKGGEVPKPIAPTLADETTGELG